MSLTEYRLLTAIYWITFTKEIAAIISSITTAMTTIWWITATATDSHRDVTGMYCTTTATTMSSASDVVIIISRIPARTTFLKQVAVTISLGCCAKTTDSDRPARTTFSDRGLQETFSSSSAGISLLAEMAPTTDSGRVVATTLSETERSGTLSVQVAKITLSAMAVNIIRMAITA